MRSDAAHRAVPDRRIFQAVDDLARFGSAINMRHHNPERAIVEGAGRDRVFAIGDARDRRDTGVERRGRDLRTSFERHDAVFHVKKQPVEAGDRHGLRDLDAAGHADADTERELSLFELLAGDVADGTHRRLPQIWRCRGGCRLAGDWASGRPDVGRERIKRSGRSGGGVDPPPAVSVFAGGELRRRRLSGSLLLGRDRRELTIALGGDLAQMRDDAAGPGGDQASDDDVLLQPLQVVDPAGDRRLCEDAGRLLERGLRDEGVGLQARLGDALQDRACRRRPQSFRFDLGVLAVELGAVDLLAGEEGRLAGIVDLYLLQHLAHDDFDVLVINAHALQSVDLLDLVDQVARELLDPKDAQDVVRYAVAVQHQVALQDVITLLHADVFALGDQVLDRLAGALVRHHDDAPLGLVILAEFDAAFALADNREILRLARLEQLGDTGQTAGDVARLRGFPRHPGEHIAGLDVRAAIDRQDRVDRQEVARLETVRQGQHLALFIAQGDARAQVAAARLLLPIDDHLRRDAGRLVEHLAHRDALDQIDVMRDAVLLGDDRDRVRVPLGDTVAALDLRPLVDEQPRTVRHPVPRLLAARLVEQHHLAVAAHCDRQPRRVDDDVAVLDLDRRVERRLDRGLLGATLRRAADVESPHRQLCAGFADRLRRDDANRLAHIHHRAAGQVT